MSLQGFALGVHHYFRPKNQEALWSIVRGTYEARNQIFWKLFSCLEDMAQKYPMEYPELENWRIEVRRITNPDILMKMTLPVLRCVAAYPTKETFADGVMVAYVFITIYHEFTQLNKELSEIFPGNPWVVQESGYISLQDIKTEQRYWEQKLRDLSPTIFGRHLRRKYAFSLCGIVKETWFQIPFFVLSTAGLFGEHRLYQEDLDIDSYKTNCKSCNKTIGNVG
jgi:hypothetical protein